MLGLTLVWPGFLKSIENDETSGVVVLLQDVDNAAILLDGPKEILVSDAVECVPYNYAIAKVETEGVSEGDNQYRSHYENAVVCSIC